MKLVIQRVTQASVEIAGECVGKIGKGYMVLFGAGAGDTKEVADKLFDKMIKLRIFQDADGKTNKSIADVGGELLIVSQFTLYANCKKEIDQALWMQENRRKQRSFMNIF